jgi:NodT family efflux transporter outer membrane factor (OMF) lipoprotein
MSSRLLAIACVGSLLSMVLALAGCTVGPRFERPETMLNDNWSEKNAPQLATQATADSAWWRAFNDPTLDRLIQLAYQQNLSLQITGLRIMEARALLGIAVGWQYPQLQVISGAATGVGLSEHAANAVIDDRYFWDYQLGFDATWEADFWGKYRGDVAAQEARYLASVADYDNALVSLTAEVARTYALVRTYEVLIEQARTNAQLQEEGLRIAESRYRNGATSELDVTQATTLLESTRATIPQLQIGLQQAQDAMCTLLGQPTGTVQTLLGASKGIPTAPAEVAVGAPAELLRRRPDIRSAEQYAVAQCARIGVAKADLYPRFSLAGSIGSQASTASGPQSGDAAVDDLFDAGSVYYFFGPRVSWPIFDYGRIKNNVRVQDARYQQLLVDYQNTVLRASQEVEDGLAGFLRSREAAAYSEKSANAAQQSAQLAFVQYREGAVDYQRVLDAQRSLLQEENSLARTRSAVATNLIALYKALGGGWEIRQGKAFVSDSTQVEMGNRTNWGGLFSEPPASSTSNGVSPTPR